MRPTIQDDDSSQYAAILARLQRLEQALPLVIEPVRFIGDVGQPAFENDWVNYDAGTSAPDFSNPDFRNAGFYKDRGRVYMQGVIKNGTGATFFTLPAGYRPFNQRGFTVLNGGATSNVAYVVVDPDGATTIGAPYSTVFVFLDAISFLAD
jgi:hypothetical protein